MSDANASGRTGRPEPGGKQQGRGPVGDLNLGASSTTGNEDESGTLFVQDAAEGSRLGAASGVASLGTAGAPPATPGGAGPRPIHDESEATEDAYRSAT